MDRKLIFLVTHFLAGPVFAAEPLMVSVKQGTHTMKPADSARPNLSADGRFVAFESGARLLLEDRNKIKDIYIFDRASGQLRRPVMPNQTRRNGGPYLSDNGRTLAFHSYADLGQKPVVPLNSDIGFLDKDSGAVHWPVKDKLGKEPDGESFFPRLDSIGESLLFSSNSTDFGSQSGFTQIYLLDPRRRGITLISQNASGRAADRPCGAPRMSADMDRAAFLSAATNFFPALPIDNSAFHLYWVDRTVGTPIRIDVFERGFDPTDNMVGAFDMDASGEILVFEARRRDLQDPFKTLASVDLYLYDRDVDCVKLLTTGLFAGKSRHPSLSADGRYLTFILNDGGGVAVHDRVTDRWQKVAEGFCDGAVLSRDGRIIAFERRDKSSKNIYVVENSLYEAP